MDEDAAMVVAIEIRLRDRVANPFPGGIVEQQAADERLLGLDRVGREFERGNLGMWGALKERS